VPAHLHYAVHRKRLLLHHRGANLVGPEMTPSEFCMNPRAARPTSSARSTWREVHPSDRDPDPAGAALAAASTLSLLIPDNLTPNPLFSSSESRSISLTVYDSQPCFVPHTTTQLCFVYRCVPLEMCPLGTSKTSSYADFGASVRGPAIRELFGKVGVVREIVMGLDKNLLTPCGQGLTLVHFSAQPEPFLTQHTPCTPSKNSLTPPEHPLNNPEMQPPISQKALTLS